MHGPVLHLLLKDEKLYAATEVGVYTVLALGVFCRSSCQGPREVWKEIPFVWREGKPVAKPGPADHPCAGAAGPTRDPRPRRGTPGTSSAERSPWRRQPTRASHVRGAATIGGRRSRQAGPLQPSNQPPEL